MAKFAEGTSVSTEKSRAEIETLLRKHGIKDICVMTLRESAMVMFNKGATGYKFVMPPIDREDYKLTAQGYERSESDTERFVSQEERRRWRALFLVLKAKLVAAADGVVTFEQEFLAFALTQDGRTVGEHVIPQLQSGAALGLQQLALPGGNQ